MRIAITSLIGLAVIGGIFIGCLILIDRLGAFQLADEKNNAQVISAVIAVAGVGVTAIISFVGLYLKHSFDSHSVRMGEAAERRLDQEATHNRELERQAEDRNRLETAIRAVQLMTARTDHNGGPTVKTQQAGALFTLANLGQVDLATALLQEVWERDDIEAAAAVRLIDRALMSDNRILQDDGAMILEENTARLLEDHGRFAWPDCAFKTWPRNISVTARERLLQALLRMTLARPYPDWDEGYRSGIYGILYLIMTRDEDARVKLGAAMAFEELLEGGFDRDGRGFFAQSEQIWFDTLLRRIALVRSVIDEDAVVATRTNKLVMQLRAWARAEATPAPTPES